MRIRVLLLITLTLLLGVELEHAWGRGGRYRGPKNAVPPWCITPGDPTTQRNPLRRWAYQDGPPLLTPVLFSYQPWPRPRGTRREQQIHAATPHGSLWQLEIWVWFRALDARLEYEGTSRLRFPPICCVTEAHMERSLAVLHGERMERAAAATAYRAALPQGVDPMLVTKVCPGRLALRVWPVLPNTETLARLTIYAFDPEAPRRTEVFVEGENALLVLPEWEARHFEVPEGSDWPTLVDAEHGRTFVFLPASGARERFPGASIHEVPCVNALRESLTNANDLAWVALPAPEADAPSSETRK